MERHVTELTGRRGDLTVPAAPATLAARVRLLAERQRLLSLRAAAQHVAAMSEEEVRRSRPQTGETTAGIHEMDKDADILMRVDRELVDVVDALARLDRGVYGSCETCGRPIDPERLAVLPAARRCVVDQTVEESARRGRAPAGGAKHAGERRQARG